MHNRKYIDDYRLVNMPDRRGRIRTVSVYAGDWYCFEMPAGALKSTKRIYIVCALTALVAVLFPLFRNVPLIRPWYVCIPAVLSLIPAAMTLISSVYIISAGEMVTREHKDRCCDGMKSASCGLLIMSVLTLTGEVVHLAAIGAGRGDIPAVIATAAALSVAVAMFSQRNKLIMKRTA